VPGGEPRSLLSNRFVMMAPQPERMSGEAGSIVLNWFPAGNAALSCREAASVAMHRVHLVAASGNSCTLDFTVLPEHVDIRDDRL
jgi:hypothetical protein